MLVIRLLTYESLMNHQRITKESPKNHQRITNRLRHENRSKPPGPLKGEEREEGEMPTGSRRNTKNLTAAKMPPKGTKRTAEPCPIQSGAKEERRGRSRSQIQFGRNEQSTNRRKESFKQSEIRIAPETGHKTNQRRGKKRY